MIGQSLLAQFHSFLKIAKATDTSAPFAGLNILFCGDFMQLPPVLDTALYVPNKVTTIELTSNNEPQNNEDCLTKDTKQKNTKNSSINTCTVTNAIGRNLWLSVKHVIELKKPM